MIGKGGQDGGMMAEINLTSLIDVMLVLMVVFMVTAPLLVPRSMGVKLPQTEAVQSTMETSPMRLTLDSNGQLQLDGQAIEDPALRSVLKTKKDDAEFQLQIEADENLRYGRLAEVMALAQSAGVKKLTFVTLSRPK
jgi:biopolymer transport protein ExbD